MKFRDGMWLPAEGVRTEYAEEVYQTTRTPQGLSLLCPTKKIFRRGDTLNTSTLTIDIEAVSDGIISVETTHWAGALDKGPHFELFPNGQPPSSLVDAVVTQGEGEKGGGTTLSSGSLSATVSSAEHTFDIRFHGPSSSADDGTTNNNKLLTSLLSRSVGFAYSPAPSTPMQLEDMRPFTHHIFTQHQLAVGESIHGLGERFGPFNKVGQSVSLWNADGGTSSDQAYKNVSFYLSSRGYGVFVNHPELVSLEIGSERVNRLQTSVKGQRLKWYIISGPSPKDVLRRYSILLGKPSPLPTWSFGLWLSTSFTTEYDEGTVRGFLEGMRDRGITVDVFHYDCFWMKAFSWTDFVFDSTRFPDPKGSMTRLKESGLVKKICVWINPYIAQAGASSAFRTAAEKGYLVKRKSTGDTWQWDLWQAGMGLVDFTNPEAVTWFASCLEGLFDQGVDAIKTDFGERIPTKDVEWFDKTVDPEKMHNYYSFLFNRTVYEAIQKRYGEKEAVLFARSACAGTQRFPLVWGGDCESTPEAMAESIRGGIGLGLSGYAFWSNDIGGFEGNPPPWIYKRWVAFGLLCSHSRLHGSGTYRVPWTIDGDDRGPEGCSAVLARWTALKSRLMPYLIAQGHKSVEGGLPLSLRAMCVEFPDDPTSWYLDRQFMVGESLLVCPVFEESGEVEFYLPGGKWTSFFSNEVREGPGWFRERHGFRSLPLYVRENTVLVLGSGSGDGNGGAVYDYVKDAEVCLYHAREGASAALFDSNGQHLGEISVGAAASEGEILGSESLTGNWSKVGDNSASGGRRIDEEESALISIKSL